MPLHTKVGGEGLDGQYVSVNPVLDGEQVTVPKHRLPDGPMSPEMAYEIIHDELMLDGNARLNLATFVTTHLEAQAEKLMAETFDKNMIDKDEYPQTAELEMRCVNMLHAARRRHRHLARAPARRGRLHPRDRQARPGAGGVSPLADERRRDPRKRPDSDGDLRFLRPDGPRNWFRATYCQTPQRGH
jgi:hypothetical protein